MTGKLRYLYDNLLIWVLAVLLAVIVVLAALQVFTRYVLDDPLRWTQEVSRLLLVWSVFLGAAAATGRNAHIKVDLVAHHLGERGLRVIELGQYLVGAAIGVSMAIYGWRFYSQTRGDFSTSLGYPRNLFYLPVSIGGALIVLFACIAIVSLLCGSPPVRQEESLVEEEEV